MGNKAFEWTDNEVRAFFQTYAAGTDDYVNGIISQYIAAKQPKPEWEILKFNHRGFQAIPLKAGYSKPHFQYACGIFSLDWALEPENDCTITSVKRLSDGEVFTVGDEFCVAHQPGDHWTIHKFEVGLEGDMRLISSPETGGYNWGLKIAQSYTEPTIPVLLTAEQIERLHNMLKMDKLRLI
jgi:hypothetical protein